MSKLFLTVIFDRPLFPLSDGSFQPSPSPPPPFYLVGDALCLDLLNTVLAGNDVLPDFASYVRWLTQAGVVTGDGTEPAGLTRWQTNTPATRAALAAVKDLRETLRAAVRAFASGQPVPEEALAAINPLLARSPVRTELVRGEGEDAGRLRKRFRVDRNSPPTCSRPWPERRRGPLQRRGPHAGPPMRGRGLHDDLSGPHPESSATLVFDGSVWQPCQGGRPPRPQEEPVRSVNPLR